MIEIGQNFSLELNEIPTKSSLFLRTVGSAVPYFSLSGSSETVIDASNVYSIDYYVNKVWFDNSSNGFTGAGYIEIDLIGFQYNNIKLNYPIKSSYNGKFYVYIRVKETVSAITSLEITTFLDDQQENSVTDIQTMDWQWISSSFVLFDQESHIFSINVDQNNVLIDKIVFSTTPLSFSGNETGPEYTDSPYLTIWNRNYKTESDLPTEFIKSLSFITSDIIEKPDWYNFEITPYNNDDYNTTSYCSICTASGQSKSHYLIWDSAKEYTDNSLENINFTGWTIDSSSSLSLRIYKSHNTIDEYNCNNIITPDAELVDYNVDNFNNKNLLYKQLNTEFVNNEDVQLDMGDKILSVIVDNSGSNSWNDINRNRFDIANNLINTLETQYPNDITFNLLELKGEKTFSFIIPLSSAPDTNSVSDVVKKYFEGNSNNFAGFRLLRKKNDYSETAIDGEIVFDGFALAALDRDLEIDTNYYYTLYTFDHKKRFSKGVRISVSTGYPFVPRGIPWIKTKTLIGYGTSKDDNTLSIWNFDEGEENYVYNFGSSSLHLTLSNIEWTGSIDIPSGKNSIRFNGSSSNAVTSQSSEFGIDLEDTISFFGWFKPFASQSNMHLFSRGNSTFINYMAILNGTTLKFTIDGTNWYTCGTTININEWNHIGITYSNTVVKFWINGSLASTVNPVSLPINTNNASNMNFKIGVDDSIISSTDYFGKLTKFSIHNIERDNSYISILSTSSINNNIDTSKVDNLTDNGDRVVVFNWKIPDDFNYSSYKIVRNKLHYPYYENDGDTIFEEENPEAGSFTLGASYTYDVNNYYWFRIFSKNSYGNWSPIEDSTPLQIFIPDQKREPIIINGTEVIPGPGFGSSPTLQITKFQAGNEKVYFAWNEPDAPATRVKIYYSDTRFIQYDPQLKDIVAEPIYNGPKEVTEFVHRNVSNQKIAYYTIVTTDRLGRFSQLVYKKIMPLENYDDSGIPLLDATDVHYSIIDYNTVEINWKSPVTISGSSQNGWFDDRFFVYASICDLYGNPIPIDYPDNFKFNTNIVSTNTNSVTNVFTSNTEDIAAEQLPKVTYHIDGSGLIFATVRINNSIGLAQFNSITINFNADYQISNDFSYNIPGVNITFKNPIGLTLINRDNLFFETTDLIENGCDTEAESGGTKKDKKRLNGTYIRRKKPFAVRAYLTYKDGPFNGSIKSNLYDGDNSFCTITPIQTITKSKKVLFASNTFLVEKIVSPILNENGEDTGFTETKTYADILFYPPQYPQSVICFVQALSKGFSLLGKMNVYFPTILKLKLSATAPASNNIDVREQFANAYLIDPDDPNNINKITYPPTNTVANWKLVAKSGVLKVPFYSTDSVPLTNGIYSYFRNGTARNIFFGPANASAAGGYTLTISTTVRGLFAEISKDLEINSTGGGGVTIPPKPDPTLPKILAEFENGINYLWADGMDYQKMTISRNPNISTTKYSDKFRECSETLFSLPIGTQITIDAPGYQIITGDVQETTINDQPSLNTENAIINLNQAKISIPKTNSVDVYFRTDQFIKKGTGCYPISVNNCVCFDLANEICYKPYNIGPYTEVKIYAKINYAGKPQTIVGGGSLDFGYPPTLLVPIEPLYLKYLGLIINGSPSPQLIADDVTINYLYWEIRYKDKGLLDFPVNINFISDPAEISGVSTQSVLGVPTSVYSDSYDELPGGGGNPDNRDYYSIVKVPVGPIPKDLNIKFAVLIELKYPSGE